MAKSINYYDRAQLAKRRILHPDSKTFNLDKVIQLTGLIIERRLEWDIECHTDDITTSLKEVFNVETTFFNLSYPPEMEQNGDDEYYSFDFDLQEWYILMLNLDKELREMFQSKNESILQNREAAYLMDNLVNLILPTFTDVHESCLKVWGDIFL
ncbi:hypothetical protein GO755_28960 [Spirosoma sp. HMF4905]|uniref:Uncharacterized protein n=1 Tax=Spirosoma arboris TaxID=2682092 RepID=A0A7K1SK32_9BACT|nr:hypothetical protein [Spirosoma arboris]MVM34098.1 hypothetical protein [Spirosoma arboris]